MLPKTGAFVKSYDEQTKWMYFLIDSERVYSKEFLKNKVKSHGIEVTDF